MRPVRRMSLGKGSTVPLGWKCCAQLLLAGAVRYSTDAWSMSSQPWRIPSVSSNTQRGLLCPS